PGRTTAGCRGLAKQRRDSLAHRDRTAIPSPARTPALVRRGAFSPDGRLLAVVTDGNSVHLWQLANGIPYGVRMSHPDRVLAVRFSPDGKRLATGSSSGVRLWDVATCQLVSRPLLTKEPISQAQFGQRQTMLALLVDRLEGWVYLWRLP